MTSWRWREGRSFSEKGVTCGHMFNWIVVVHQQEQRFGTITWVHFSCGTFRQFLRQRRGLQRRGSCQTGGQRSPSSRGWRGVWWSCARSRPGEVVSLHWFNSCSSVLVALQWVGQEMVEVSNSYDCDCCVMMLWLLWLWCDCYDCDCGRGKSWWRLVSATVMIVGSRVPASYCHWGTNQTSSLSADIIIFKALFSSLSAQWSSEKCRD